MKIFRKNFLTVLSVISAVLCLCGCSKLNDIKLLSCSLESVSPVGLRGVKAELALQIENPALQFTMSDIEGVINYKGRRYAAYSSEPVKVEARTVAVYPLFCQASIANDVSFLELLALLQNYNINDFTTDIHAKVILKGGISKAFDFKNVPLNKFVK